MAKQKTTTKRKMTPAQQKNLEKGFEKGVMKYLDNPKVKKVVFKHVQANKKQYKHWIED